MKNSSDHSAPIACPHALAQRPKSERYEPPPINLENRNNSQTLAIEMIGKNKRVLEVGTSTGYVTKVLQQLGNRVTGIEIDKNAGDAARQFCESMIIGDAEELELDSYFEPSSFDIVLLGDILEHLQWPGRLLVRLRKYLKPGGYLVVSIPNVCHGDLLLNLFNSDFKYTSMGLLDETHLRFFGRRSIIRFFADNGYAIEELHTVRVPIGGTEQRMDLNKVPTELLKLIKALPDSEVFQFVFKAVPSDCSPGEAVPEIDFHTLFATAVEDMRKKHEAEITFSSENLLQAEAKVAELENETLRLRQALADQEGKLLDATSRALNSERSVLDRDAQIASMHRSIIWQATMKFNNSFVERLLPQGSERRRKYDQGLNACRILVNGGCSSFSCQMKEKIRKLKYFTNFSHINKLSEADLERMREECKDYRYKPKISIIAPMSNSKEQCFAIESVLSQIYENWELCLVDSDSMKPHVTRILKKHAKKDNRIKVRFLPDKPDITEKFNQALALSTGDFVGFLDHDDELTTFALCEVVKLLNDKHELDFIYSDEDKINGKKIAIDPFFKPDWSPDMFLSTNYIGSFFVIRKSLLDKVGRSAEGYNRFQNYDLLLRAFEHTSEERIAHIPKIIYHRRIIAASIPSSCEEKPYASIAAKKALKDAMARRKIEIEDVIDGLCRDSYRIKYKIVGNPKVSIIIPTRDKVDVLKICVNSILDKTIYNNYDIFIVDNDSKENSTFAYYDEIKNNIKVTILHFDEPFNFSSMNNFAVSQLNSEYILFLNCDTEIISPEWLSSMLEHAQRSDVGAVGARLLYPDNTIQHAGVITGVGGVAGHSHTHIPVSDPGYFGRAQLIQNLTAVTAACLLTKKTIFEEVGGFDEENLAIAFNDIDFCLNLRKKGYRVIYTPYATLYHYESLFRGSEDTPEKQERFAKEVRYMKEKWGHTLDSDPYYNPNLTLEKGDFSIRI